MEITQKLLNELFYYEDGKLFNKARRANCAKIGDRAGSRVSNKCWRIIKIGKKTIVEQKVIFLMHYGWNPDSIEYIDNSINKEGIKSNVLENLKPIKRSRIVTREALLEMFYYDNGRLFNKKDRNGGGKKAGSRSGSKVVNREYWSVWINGRFFSEHRAIFLMHHGWLPKYIDHISDDLTEEGVKCNLIDNLRETTNGQNRQKGKHKSKYKGVYWNKKSKKWRATISVNWKRVSLGLYHNPIDAAKAYDKKAFEVFGEHAGFNFKEDYRGSV